MPFWSTTNLKERMQVLRTNTLLATSARTSILGDTFTAMNLQWLKTAFVAFGAHLAWPIWEQLVLDQSLDYLSVRARKQFSHGALPVGLLLANTTCLHSASASDLWNFLPSKRLDRGWALEHLTPLTFLRIREGVEFLRHDTDAARTKAS